MISDKTNEDKLRENFEFSSNRISSEVVNLTDSVNDYQSNLDNLVFESKIDENAGNNLNEYLNSNPLEGQSKNIYEKILNKLQEKRDELYSNPIPINNEGQDFSEERSEEDPDEEREIDLEKFYENRQFQYEEALLRKSSTSKQKISSKTVNNSTSKIQNIEYDGEKKKIKANDKNKNESLNITTNNVSKTENYNKQKENLVNIDFKNKNRSPIENFKNDISSVIQNKYTNRSTISSKIDNYDSNNPKVNSSITTLGNSSRNHKKTINITHYDDYKNKSVIKNKTREMSLNISLRKSSVENRDMPKSIKRTYSDRLLSLNKSIKTKKKIPNDEKFVNIKIVNDSIEEVIDFEKIGNISISMIKTNRLQDVKNNNNPYKINDSSYKNIYSKRKTLENSQYSHSTNLQPNKNSNELLVNMFRNSTKTFNKSKKDDHKDNVINYPNIKDEIKIDTNAPSTLIKTDIKKTQPVTVSIHNQEDKKLNKNFNENISRVDLNSTSNHLNSNQSYKNILSNTIKERDPKKYSSVKSDNINKEINEEKKKDNLINIINNNLIITSEHAVTEVDMHHIPKKSEIKSLLKESKQLESPNKASSEIATDFNPIIKQESTHVNKEFIKHSISLNVKELIHNNNYSSMHIYVKPKLSNRMNRSYSSAKSKSVKIINSNNLNNFDDFYKKNLNWKKSIEDDLKVLKEQKQIDELKDCSFTPKVLNSSTKIISGKKERNTITSNPNDFYLKNLKWKSKIEKFKQDEFIEKERKEFSECIFRPNYKKLNNKLGLSDKSSPIKVKADNMYKKSLVWLNKINENKKIKQLEIEEEMKDKSKHIKIYDRINRSRSKSREKMKNIKNSIDELQENSLNEVDTTNRLNTEGQKLKEDLSSVNVRSNYFSSMSNRSNNFFVLYKELERNTLDKDMKELKELIVSLKATLEENKKMFEEKDERNANKSTLTGANNDMNININQSYNITVNELKSGNNRVNTNENKKMKRNYSFDKVIDYTH